MKVKLATTLAIAALVPFALVACGDDDEETPTDTPPATPQTDNGGTKGGGGGSTVEISADPGGSLAYEQDAAEAEAGAVTIAFTNDSSTPHDVKVESPDGELGGTDTISGDSTEATVDLEAGDYTFYCSVAGHREAGMEGTLTVK